VVPVRDDLHLFDGHHAPGHHLVEDGQESVNLLQRVHDLHHDRKVLRQAQNLGRVDAAVAVAEMASQDLSSGQMMLAGASTITS
jgi:hypothetical protein